MMKILKLLALVALFFQVTSPQVHAAGEPWKGKTEVSPVELGLMAGAAIYGKDINWSSLASMAYLLKDQGFLDEIDDRLWIEMELGPTFFSTRNSNETGLQYSTHLRWDFTYNEFWTLYALGGLSGFGLPSSYDSSFTIHPRFGAGVQYLTKAALSFRGEVSAEFIGLGIALNF
ncbi:MAG: hypothetical protein KGP28_01560 [Bdellovibrionales bacterium]|nr:hypothetical protein [Bdellovibrionales bacterium]